MMTKNEIIAMNTGKACDAIEMAQARLDGAKACVWYLNSFAHRAGGSDGEAVSLAARLMAAEIFAGTGK